MNREMKRSSQRESSGPMGKAGETIDHLQFFAENGKGAKHDILFRVGSQIVPAYQLVLSLNNDYFSALFRDDPNKKNRANFLDSDEIEVEGASAEAFEKLIHYVRYPKLSVTTNQRELVNLLKLADQYRLPLLAESISEILISILDMANVSSIYHVAILYRQSALSEACLQLIDAHPNDFLAGNTFTTLPSEDLCEIFQRDSFVAPEIEIFQAVQRWWTAKTSDNHDTDVLMENVQRTELNELLNTVRLPLISSRNIFQIVRPAKLFTDSQLLDAFEQNYSGSKIKGRKQMQSQSNEEQARSPERDGPDHSGRADSSVPTPLPRPRHSNQSMNQSYQSSSEESLAFPWPRHSY